MYQDLIKVGGGGEEEVWRESEAAGRDGPARASVWLSQPLCTTIKTPTGPLLCELVCNGFPLQQSLHL